MIRCNAKLTCCSDPDSHHWYPTMAQESRQTNYKIQEEHLTHVESDIYFWCISTTRWSAKAIYTLMGGSCPYHHTNCNACNHSIARTSHFSWGHSQHTISKSHIRREPDHPTLHGCVQGVWGLQMSKALGSRDHIPIRGDPGRYHHASRWQPAPRQDPMS